MLGAKVPLPPLQTPPVATVTLPFKAALALFEQSEMFAPALAVGAGVIVYVTWLLTALQLPLPAEVRVKVTLPFAISPAVGV